LSITGALPDETTILNFRHLLEKHQPGKKLFKEINTHLDNAGLVLKQGTIVDASIISAPTSTRNKDKQRDPQMHQTRKGNEWHFGMKLPIGVDDSFGVIHSLSTTAANAHDITEADQLLHVEEEQVRGDAGYLGIEKREAHKDRDVQWQINVRPGKRKQIEKGSGEARHERAKAPVRAMVEHPALLIKRRFGYSKVRYRGLAKNTNRLYLLSGFNNLIRMKSILLA
jgi:IS5 family transposase